MAISKLYCHQSDIDLIKRLKKDFVNQLIGNNIRYEVCGHVSANLNQSIKEIENHNLKKIA